MNPTPAILALLLLTGCAGSPVRIAIFGESARHVSTFNYGGIGLWNGKIYIDDSLAKHTANEGTQYTTTETYNIGNLFTKVFTGKSDAPYTLRYVRSTFESSSMSGEVQYTLTTKLTGPDGTGYIAIETTEALPDFAFSWTETRELALIKAVRQTYYETLSITGDDQTDPPDDSIEHLLHY